MWDANLATPHGDDNHFRLWLDPDLDLRTTVHGETKNCVLTDSWGRAIGTFYQAMKKWEGHRKKWGQEMGVLLRQYDKGPGTSTTVRGSIQDDAMSDDVKGKIGELYAAYRRLLLDAHPSPNDNSVLFAGTSRRHENRLIEASALFVAAYKHSQYTCQDQQGFRGLQFPWRVAGDFLTEIKVRRLQERNGGAIGFYNARAMRSLGSR